MDAGKEREPMQKMGKMEKKRANRWGYGRKIHLKLLEGPLLSRVWPANRVVLGMRVSKWVREQLVDHTELVLLEHHSSGHTAHQERDGALAARIREDIGRFKHSGVKIELLARAASLSFVHVLVNGLSIGEGCSALITHLDISDCKLTSFENLCTVLRGCRALRTLNLSGCAVTAEGVGLLAENMSAECFPQLEVLNLSENRIGAAGARRFCAALEACTALTNLDLGANAFGSQGLFSDPPHHFLQHLGGTSASLTHLDLSRNHLNGDLLALLAAGLIQRCTALQALVLSRNSLAGEGVGQLGGALRACTALTRLDLSWNSIGTEGIDRVAGAVVGSKRLRTLELSHCCVDADGVSVLAAVLAECATLEALDLSWNALGSEGAGHLALALGDCTALRALRLSGNNLCVDGAEALATAVGSMSALTLLDLSRNSIGGEGATHVGQALGAGVGCPGLEVLYVSENNIGAEGAGALAQGAARCARLRELHLPDNSLGARGAGRVADVVGQWKGLERLEVGKNGIGNKGVAQVLRAARQSRNLERLGVGYNGITDPGAASVAGALGGCRALRVLDLQCNKIGDRGAAALAEGLAQAPALQRLLLRSNAIGEEGTAALEKARAARPREGRGGASVDMAFNRMHPNHNSKLGWLCGW